LPQDVTIDSHDWELIDEESSVGDVKDLIINLVAAIIVFASGILTREFLHFIHVRQGRTFWGRRMLRSRLLLFVGEFPRFNHLEPSGMLGLGDVHAVHEMTTGLAALRSSFEIVYSSQVAEGQHREDMILLGGTEVNTLTLPILEKVGSNFRLDNDAMTITDGRTQKVYGTEWDVDPLDGASGRDFDHSWFISTDAEGARVARRFRTDYGILVRGRNPFARERRLVMICGIYGFGTWAGARLPFDDEFLRRIRDLDYFECLFRVQVHQRQLLKTDIEVLRALPDTPPVRDSALTVPGRWAHRSGSRPPYGPGDSRPVPSGDGRSVD
jgi:hypothetical protein